MPRILHDLITRVSEGDAGAFREIFEKYSPKVYAFALKLTQSQSTAEELVQDVFLRIWVGRASLTSIDYFPTYLYTVTRNLALNALKRTAIEERAKAELIRVVPIGHSDTEESIVYRDYQRILNNAIDKLSPQQRNVFSLCHVQGLKYEEAAQKLRISRLTVKTHMQQALRTIKLHVSQMIAVAAIFMVALR